MSSNKAIAHLMRMHQSVTSTYRHPGQQEPNWKRLVRELNLFPDQFYQVLAMHSGEVLDCHGFEENLGFRACDVSLPTIAGLMLPVHLESVVRMSEVALVIGRKLRTFTKGHGIFMYPQYDAFGRQLMVRRRSVVTDVSRDHKPTVTVSVYQRLDNVPIEREAGGWLSGSGRDDIVKAWQQSRRVESVSLSRRERQVLGLITRGATSQDMAQELGIRRSTVDTIRRRLLQKSGLRDSVDLVAKFGSHPDLGNVEDDE